jgi:hypothetical protein
LAMTVGSPPSRTETTELVVPRSIPTARAMVFVPPGEWESSLRLPVCPPYDGYVNNLEPSRLNYSLT